ncbi:MAG: hypothetical protein AAGJ35_08495, partial [Myxococcota bacterium]
FAGGAHYGATSGSSIIQAYSTGGRTHSYVQTCACVCVCVLDFPLISYSPFPGYEHPLSLYSRIAVGDVSA